MLEVVDAWRASQPVELVLGSGFLGFALSAVVWPVVSYALTVAHEGAHALTVAMTSGKVRSITVSRGGGLTTFSGAGPLGSFFIFLTGYLGPSAFGLAGAVLLAGNKVAAVLGISLVLLFLALIQAGNFAARATILVVGTIIVLVLRHASAGQQLFFAYTWIWFLLIGGFANVLVLQHIRGQGPDKLSDAYQLRKLSLLPASLWSGFFWLSTLAALGYGAAILFGLVEVGR